MTYCEGCQHYEQHFFEDRGDCLKDPRKKKPVEATDPACNYFEPLEGQIKLEV